MSMETNFDAFLTDDHLVYLENESIRIGVNLSLGGALTYVAENGQKNLINSRDWGRQVQMSFYDHPIPYQPAGYQMVERWKHIGWNPIQSGDVFGNRSRVLDWRAENGEVYVKCIPMHWPLSGCEGECTFEVWYRLEGNCVTATARLNNARPDTAQHPARWQELPAIYTNGEWYRAVSYVGKKPFSGDALTELVTKDDGRGYPWLQFYPTENWSALVNDENRGLGIWIGFTSFSRIGFWDEKNKGWGGARDCQTGYVGPVAPEVLDHDIVYTYSYTLIVGTLDDIRQTAYRKNSSFARNRFSFEHDRNHFYYKDIVDQGFPTGGCLEFDFGKGSEVKSPPLFYEARQYRCICLDAAFEGQLRGEVVLHLYKGLDERNWGVLEDYCIPFELAGSGERGIHTLDISSAPDCYIGFSIRFADSGHMKLFEVELTGD